MNLIIKLSAPYITPGQPAEQELQLKAHSIKLEQLAFYLNQRWCDRLATALIDERGLLTAEFIVNGSHAPLDCILQDGDQVTMIPYICGG